MTCVRPKDQRDSRRSRCGHLRHGIATREGAGARAGDDGPEERGTRVAGGGAAQAVRRLPRRTTSSAPSRRGTTRPTRRPQAARRPPAFSRCRATSSRRKTSTSIAICGWTSGTTAATARSRSTPSGATTRADPGRSKTTIRIRRPGATASATTRARPSSARTHSRPRASTTKHYSPRPRRAADRPRTRRTTLPDWNGRYTRNMNLAFGRGQARRRRRSSPGRVRRTAAVGDGVGQSDAHDPVAAHTGVSAALRAADVSQGQQQRGAVLVDVLPPRRTAAMVVRTRRPESARCHGRPRARAVPWRHRQRAASRADRPLVRSQRQGATSRCGSTELAWARRSASGTATR